MPVQRWRLRFERGVAAAALPQRDIDEAWEVATAGFRQVMAQGPERPRIVIGAPLPVGMTAGLELADLLLPARRRLPDVRAVLGTSLPADHRLVDLYDVWIGEPALPGLVIAGDYRVAVATLDDAGNSPGAMSERAVEAVRTLLVAAELPRVRRKGGRTTVGNLRPLILDVKAPDPADPAPSTLDLWMRLRFHPSQGTGRPEEVVAVLSSILEQELKIVRLHRERLWLQGELPG
jgi:hypothetical protein